MLLLPDLQETEHSVRFGLFRGCLMSVANILQYSHPILKSVVQLAWRCKW